MEKFFRPNRFFLFFCILFVVEWFALQMVGYMHLTNQAKIDGERILNWSWPSKNIRSIAEIYDTKILHRSNNDATVKVLAKEHMEQVRAENTGGLYPPLHESRPSLAPTKCAAQLSYYRMNNKWFLGRVEFE